MFPQRKGGHGRSSARPHPPKSPRGTAGPGSAAPLPLWPGLLAATLCAAVYLGVGGGFLRFRPSTFIHHILTANAWLHGRLDVSAEEIERQFLSNRLARSGRPVAQDAPLESLRKEYRERIARAQRVKNPRVTDAEIDFKLREAIHGAFHDWVRWNGKYFAYWPPLPALVCVPFVVLAGPAASDVLVGNLLGAATALAAYLMLRQFKPFLPVLNAWTCAALTLFYGLGTCHMFQACVGQVWFITQLAGTLMLFLAAWLGLKAAHAPAWLPAAGLALGLGFLGRNTIILAAPFFAVVLWIAWRHHGASTARCAAAGAGFAAAVAAAVAVQLWFNAARFGDPLDFGQGHLADAGGNPRFREEFKTYGRFHPHYVPRNVWYYFLNPRVRQHPTVPGLTFDAMGNSLFLVSPPMVYLFAALRRRGTIRTALLAGALPGTAALMLFHGTGFYQFGQRYLLDVMPFLLLMVAWGLGGRLTRTAAALILLAMAVNAWGTWRFCLEQR